MINLFTGLVASTLITASSVSFMESIVSSHATQEKYIAALLCDMNA